VHDQKEAVTPAPAALRRLAVACLTLAPMLACLAQPPKPKPAPEAPKVAAKAPAAKATPAAAQPDANPGFALMDLAALKRASRESGRPVLLHFWASWCGPCLEELPVIEQVARDARARGVELVSVSLDQPDRAGERVVRVLSQSAPSLTRNIADIDDADTFIAAVDPRWEGAIPALFAYDAKGQPRGRLIGEAARRDLDALVAKLVKAGGRN
jgi:thiol-disulfide isomerase/thioredoxin